MAGLRPGDRRGGVPDLVGDARLAGTFLGFVGGLGLPLLLAVARNPAGAGRRQGLQGSVGVSWRYGIANLSRRRGESVIQIVAFGRTGIVVLLLLAVVRNDLLADWRRSLLERDLLNFFINIPPADREPFVAFLENRRGAFARAADDPRATAAERPRCRVDGFASPRGEGFARREQNITWQDDLGRDNRVSRVAGMDSGGPRQTAGVDLDRGAGRPGPRHRRQDDLRRRRRESGRRSRASVKGQMGQLPAELLPGVSRPACSTTMAGTWMTSAYFKPQEGARSRDLVRRFPRASRCSTSTSC